MYTPATQEAIVDNASTMSLACVRQSRATSVKAIGTKAKRVNWAETQEKREKLQRCEAQDARLLTEQKPTANNSHAKFAISHAYKLQLTREICSINAAMPQNTCPDTCIVKGTCLCNVHDQG